MGYWSRRRKNAETTKRKREEPAEPPGEPATTGSVLSATDRTFDELTAGRFALVDFWAPWCGPCRDFYPLFEQVADSWTNDEVVFVRVNVDDNKILAARYRVMSVPTVAVFGRRGEVIEMRTGVQTPAALEEMIEFVNEPD